MAQRSDGVPAGRQPRFRPDGRIHYRGGSVHVTDRWLVTPDRRYKIADLVELRTVRRPLRPVVRAVAGGSSVLLFALILAAVLVGRGPATLGTAGAALAGGVLAAVVWRSQGCRYELWAGYRGRSVLVFCTSDETTYGLLCRALTRARESGRRSTAPGAVRLPPAA